MTVKDIVEAVSVAIVMVGGMFAILKARKETVGTSDETARRLREDLSAMDRLVRRLRRMLHQLEVWVIDHMRSSHDESFNPGDVYQGADDAD